MANRDTESGFQTPASKKRKASESPSLPPASQSTMTPTSCKNSTPLIVTGTDPKYNTQLRIMSELRQYHPRLRVFQLKQSQNGWIFTLPKISPSSRLNQKCRKFLGETLSCHFLHHISLQMPQKEKFWCLRQYLQT